MNLDRTTITVRERSLPELFDLALLVCRQHGVALLLLAAAGCGPFLLLDWWLITGGEPTEMHRWWWLLLLIAVEGPFATAPISAYLGQAMFDERPSVRAALATCRRRWGGLLVAGLWRGLLSLFPLLLLLWPAHLVEVLMLESQSFAASRRRAAAMRSAWGGDWALHLLLSAVVCAASVWCIVGTVAAFSGLLMHADPWINASGERWNPGTSVVPHIAVWLAVGFSAVVRFLAYIDLRTRHEGWELGLALRQAAGRIGGGAA